MPVLIEEQPTKKVTLEKTGAVVEIKETQNYNEFLKIRAEIDKGKDESLALLESRIVDWDFTDKEGKKLPVNSKNIGLIPMMDVNQLFRETSEFESDEEEIKKETSN